MERPSSAGCLPRCLLCHSPTFIYSEYIRTRVWLFSSVRQRTGLMEPILIGIAWYIYTQMDSRSFLPVWLNTLLILWRSTLVLTDGGLKVRPVVHIWHLSMHAPARSLVMYTGIYAVTPAPESVWNNLRVKCLAQGLVGRCSRKKYGYMCEPTHQFVHRAHFCRNHLTDQMSHYYCRIENPPEMIKQQALWLSYLKLNITKRQSLQLKPVTATVVMRVASVVILEQQSFLVYLLFPFSYSIQNTLGFWLAGCLGTPQ